MNKLSTAKLSWNADNIPYSLDYGDVYFSDQHALEESTHVFLEANQLKQRWQSLESGQFIIGECGFGGGLNFLNTCKLWCDLKPDNTSLHYLACELHPFQVNDLQRLADNFPALAEYSTALLKHYPPLCRGLHQRVITLGKQKIYLTLAFGDATLMFKQLIQTHGFKVDAWFLDGFSPGSNPEIWQLPLCRTLAALSKNGTTLSTYSAAGTVKEALRKAGFSIKRQTGFGRKRHMLFATYTRACNSNKDDEKHCFTLPPPVCTSRHAIVIGAGLAGCSSAFSLAEAGWQVSIIERQAEIASMASGNSRGIVACKLSAASFASTEFYLQAYLHASQHYNKLAENFSFDWQPDGLLQLAYDSREQKKQTKILENFSLGNQVQAVDAQRASAISGIKLDTGGLYFPPGASLNPRALCRAYLQHGAIKIILNQEALRLQYHDGLWQVLGKAQTIAKAPVVIIANSYDASVFRQSQHYPLLNNFGQLDEYLNPEGHTGVNCIVSGKAYMLPTAEKGLLLGGLTLADSWDQISLHMGSKLNLQLVKQINKSLAASLSTQGPVTSRQALRCTSPDYMPLLGPVEKVSQCQDIYAELARNAQKKISQTPDYEPGLYINVAHGSNGLSNTPLAASYLCALINGTPPPLANQVTECLHPIRFLIRDLKRQKLLSA